MTVNLINAQDTMQLVTRGEYMMEALEGNMSLRCHPLRPGTATHTLFSDYLRYLQVFEKKREGARVGLFNRTSCSDESGNFGEALVTR